MKKFIFGFLEFIGLITFIIGFLGLVGNVFDYEIFYHWLKTPLSINASIVFILQGIGSVFVVLLLRDDRVVIQEPFYNLSVFKIQSSDIIALISIIGCFIMLWSGKGNDVMGIMITIIGFYFGRVVGSATKNGNGH